MTGLSEGDEGKSFMDEEPLGDLVRLSLAPKAVLPSEDSVSNDPMGDVRLGGSVKVCTSLHPPPRGILEWSGDPDGDELSIV
jgi:hypothetical protein